MFFGERVRCTECKFLICMEVRMSSLLVVWAPYDIKGAKLGHSHFIGWQACGMWEELNSTWIRIKKIF